MSTKLLINSREWFIHVFKKKILLVEKDNEIVKNKYIIIPLNLFYFFYIKDLLKYNNINMIYELDGLIFYDDNKIHTLTINQIMLNFNIIDPNNSNNIKEIIEQINKYSKQIPFYIIVEMENIDKNLNIQIILMNCGKIKIKEFEIQQIINKKLYELIL
jgi:hypothetical protein